MARKHVSRRPLRSASGSDSRDHVDEGIARKRALMQIAGERDVLELLARGAALSDVLTRLARAYEEIFPHMLCSVLLLDEDGQHLRHGAAPSLPEDYCRAVDGLLIGSNAGSCGTAAYTRQTTVVSDIANDPLWRDGREVALAHGLRACWSVPVFSSQDEVMGTFAFYYREPRAPEPHEIEAIGHGARMAGLAIERCRLVQTLRDSEARYRDLIESSQDLIAAHDLQGNVLSMNEAAVRLSGYSRPALLRMNLADLLAPEVRHEFAAYLAEIQAKGQARGIMRIRTAGGDARYWEYRNTLRSERGTVPMVSGVARDITDRVEAEIALRAQTEEIERYFTTALDLFCVADTDGYFRRLNKQWEATLGYSLADLEGHRFLDFVHPDDHAATLQAMSRLTRQETSLGFINRYRRKDGSYCWLEWRSNPAGRLIYAAARDITRHVQVETELHEVQERLQQAVSGGNVGLWNVDLTTNRAYYSPEWKRQIGYADHEITDHIDEWLGRVHPDDVDRVRRFLQESLANDESAFEHELRLRHKDGSYRNILASGSLVRDDGNRPVRVVGTHVDITDRMQLQAQLLQAQKMESVGQLAGGIAHDFNNLLTVINGMADLALTTLKDGDPLQNELQEIRKAGERAAALTQRLLGFSRRQVMQPKVLSLNAVVDGMRQMLERVIGEDVSLVCSLPEGLDCVRADPVQIEQVIMNLAVNARDAMPGGGRLVIETRNMDLDEAYTTQHPLVRPGPCVMLAVGDTGVGIDEASRERIFEPFFTTKETGRGTGLGLSTVYGIVAQSGGHIQVYSEVGHGTTFRVYLPRVENETCPQPHVPNGTAVRGEETILIVEDEAGVRNLTKRVLESAGYAVISAADGSEALRLLEQSAVTPHLMMTDLVMPGMSGRDLAEQVSFAHPAMKVLYTSGYTDDDIVRRGALADRVHFIGKPYAVSELTRKVREVLDSYRDGSPVTTRTGIP